MKFGFIKGTGTANTISIVLELANEAAKGVVQDKNLCILVTFDVKNAFNSTSWGLIYSAVAGFCLL